MKFRGHMNGPPYIKREDNEFKSLVWRELGALIKMERSLGSGLFTVVGRKRAVKLNG
jgi:hypothetical protein